MPFEVFSYAQFTLTFWVAVVLKAWLMISQLYKNKVGVFIDLSCQRNKHTHTHTHKSHTQELDNHRAMQQLLEISASSVSLERSCFVFSEWRCSFLWAQHNPVPRVQLGLAEIL
jgi:hypothetical protein